MKKHKNTVDHKRAVLATFFETSNEDINSYTGIILQPRQCMEIGFFAVVFECTDLFFFGLFKTWKTMMNILFKDGMPLANQGCEPSKKLRVQFECWHMEALLIQMTNTFELEKALHSRAWIISAAQYMRYMAKPTSVILLQRT